MDDQDEGSGDRRLLSSSARRMMYTFTILKFIEL